MTAPSRRRRWRIAARCVLAPALLTGLLTAAPTASGLERQADPASDPVSGLADCASRTGRLFVVVLVDESLSLRRTDPEDRRVEGIQTGLTSLAQVADRTAGSETPVSVQVSMLGFGVDTTEVVGWSNLDGGTLPDLLAGSRKFAERDRQIDTDYAAALLGARDQLAKVVDPAAADQACTAILWFTDGKYDIETRSTGERKSYAPDIAINGAESAAALEAAGKNLLCQEGGVIDGLRLGGTQILAVALSTQIEPPDQDFLRSVAEASGPQRCGVARPEGAPPPGAYLGAADIGSLITAFFDTISKAGGGTGGPGAEDLPVCPLIGCESGTHSFPVDPGILTFNLLAVSSVEGIDVDLRSPEPDAVPLGISRSQQTGEGTLGSASVRWTWVSAEAVLVDAAVPADEGPWNGSWSVTFIDRAGTSPGAVADAHIYVFGDLEPYVETLELRAGEENRVVVGVRHRKGTPVDESLFADVGLEVTVVNPNDGSRERITLGEPGADGTRKGVWKAPAPDFPAKVNISATARVTTSSGQALTPVTRTIAVDVLPPSSYPTIEPATLRFPMITGTEPTEAVVTVRGGKASGGCVWIDDSAVTQSPKEAGTVVVSSEPAASSKETCLHVDAGQERTMRFLLTPESAANGSSAGNFQVALTSDTNPNLLRTEIAWTAPLQKPVDTAVRNKVFGELMAAGLLLPLLLMWLLKWLTARFEPPSQLKFALIDATVSKDGNVARRDGKQSGLEVRPDDFKALNESGKPREFDAGPVHFASRTGWSPFAAPKGEASAPGFAVGSLPPATTGRSLDTTQVAFGLAGTAIVLVSEAALASDDPERPEIAITLVLFAPAAEISRYSTHFDAHRSTVKTVVNALRERHETWAAVNAPKPTPPTAGSPDAAGGRTEGPGDAPPGRRNRRNDGPDPPPGDSPPVDLPPSRHARRTGDAGPSAPPMANSPTPNGSTRAGQPVPPLPDAPPGRRRRTAPLPPSTSTDDPVPPRRGSH